MHLSPHRCTHINEKLKIVDISSKLEALPQAEKLINQVEVGLLEVGNCSFPLPNNHPVLVISIFLDLSCFQV